MCRNWRALNICISFEQYAWDLWWAIIFSLRIWPIFCIFVKVSKICLEILMKNWWCSTNKWNNLQYPIEGIVKSGVPQGSLLCPLLFLIFINGLENELTCNHLFFAVKLIAPRSQQHELRSSIQKTLSWSRRWDLPLNASKSHRLSIGGPPDHRLVLSEETNGELMKKYQRINDMGKTVNSAFTTSANVPPAPNKARGIYMPDEGDLCTSI